MISIHPQYIKDTNGKKSLVILFLVATILTFLIGCKKEDNAYSNNNPINGKSTAVFNPVKDYGTLTDQQGNVYKTILIGTQTWMAENLRTTKYRSGEAIPEVTDQSEWISSTTGAFCNYQNTRNDTLICTYGRLYNWYAVSDTRNLAPEGWHLASVSEWTTLTTFLGGEQGFAGKKLREAGDSHWVGFTGESSTNESGFTGLPNGYRLNYDEEFRHLGESAYLWTISDFDSTRAWSSYLLRDCYGVKYDKIRGFAVRCVKD